MAPGQGRQANQSCRGGLVGRGGPASEEHLTQELLADVHKALGNLAAAAFVFYLSGRLVF